ncbi:hypothetical protein [Actinoplanes sp. SE50/110]|uniref:hypothetical protein n=1 Tax=unclassified Actinoplanes TaxID=2626549 RepID=UPI00043A2E9D
MTAGEDQRDQRYLTTRITADGRDGHPGEAGRCRLVVSRAIIVRRLCRPGRPGSERPAHPARP